MKSFYRWSLHLLTLGVTATGVLYFWMKYLLESEDPFSIINHPWQNLMLHGHILFSPLLLFVFGVFFNSHVMRKLRNGQPQGRRSGLASLLVFPLMAISGYALQVVTQETVLQAALIVHLVSGGLFALVYLVHLIVGLRNWRPASNLKHSSRRGNKAIAA
ncbi:MAG TPA: hypothetical protein VLV83_13600 [Acidobacteriota bacterium]|nr:hypothetical protein [Acidobacteriota bacterium]